MLLTASTRNGFPSVLPYSTRGWNVISGNNGKEKKASVNEWSAAVRDKVSNIISRKNDLLTRHNEILAQIRSLSFVSTNDDLQNFFIPPGYSVSNNGIEKVAGESMISA